MSAPMTEALPYGIRDVKLTPYADAAGTVLGTTSYDLPNMQTLTFAEKEEFQELRGDDRIVTTRGKGAQVDWSLEAGGISPRCWAIFTGGEVIEAGVLPNRSTTMRKRGSDSRPYFRAEGQAISDSGGDVHTILYRCRCNDSIEGEFKDGEFFVTSASGIGLPLLDDTNDILYDIVQNESKTSIPLTPTPNPISAPQNVSVGVIAATTVALTWSAVNGASGYKVEQSVAPYSAWTAVARAAGGEPATAGTTVTGLTAATPYKFRVKAVVGTDTSGPSADTGVVTTLAA